MLMSAVTVTEPSAPRDPLELIPAKATRKDGTTYTLSWATMIEVKFPDDAMLRRRRAMAVPPSRAHAVRSTLATGSAGRSHFMFPLDQGGLLEPVATWRRSRPWAAPPSDLRRCHGRNGIPRSGLATLRCWAVPLSCRFLGRTGSECGTGIRSEDRLGSAAPL